MKIFGKEIPTTSFDNLIRPFKTLITKVKFSITSYINKPAVVVTSTKDSELFMYYKGSLDSLHSKQPNENTLLHENKLLVELHKRINTDNRLDDDSREDLKQTCNMYFQENRIQYRAILNEQKPENLSDDDKLLREISELKKQLKLKDEYLKKLGNEIYNLKFNYERSEDALNDMFIADKDNKTAIKYLKKLNNQLNDRLTNRKDTRIKTLQNEHLAPSNEQQEAQTYMTLQGKEITSCDWNIIYAYISKLTNMSCIAKLKNPGFNSLQQAAYFTSKIEEALRKTSFASDNTEYLFCNKFDDTAQVYAVVMHSFNHFIKRLLYSAVKYDNTPKSSISIPVQQLATMIGKGLAPLRKIPSLR